MPKKLILVFVCAIFFSGFSLAKADVVINEIAWKGTSTGSTHEWLELANNSSLVDLSGWTIKDGENQLNITLPDGAAIQDGGFYVIKRSTSDITPFDFSTAFSGGLSDSGEKLILADSAGVIKETLDFSGGWPDPTMTSEDTMQWNGSSWVIALPTPGLVNATEASPVQVSNSDSVATDSNSNNPIDIISTSTVTSTSSSSSSSSSGAAKNKKVEQKIKTQIIGKTLGLIGLPVSLQATSTGHSGEPLYFGKYFWNFGDGDSKEVGASDIKPFTHTYYYPGDYVVSLDYYQNNFTDILIPDASAQVTIKIVPVDVSISNVGDEKDFFVELSNNTGYSSDVSNWILKSDQKSFIIPRNTILQAKGKMIISSRITNFSVTDKDSLKLITPQGNIAFDYSLPLVHNSTDVGRLQSRRPTSVVSEPIKLSSSKVKNKKITQAEIPMDSLAAASILGDANKTDTINNSNNKIISLISFIFISASAYLVYFVRRKMFVAKSIVSDNSKSAGDDFEILDE